MSGGYYDYAYSQIDNLAVSLSARAHNTPERLAFVVLLQKVAKAAHDIEWVDSGDYAEGDEVPAIRACVSLGDVLRAAVEAATKVRDELTALLNEAQP
jgi:hypothetical protein